MITITTALSRIAIPLRFIATAYAERYASPAGS